MTKLFRNLTIAGCLAALCLSLGADAATVELSPCDLSAKDGREEVDAECGTLAVPLDPSDPDGETIELFIALVPALAEQPSPDPLVVIAGGPGEAATRFYVTAEAAFSRIVRQRDILLVDQRGTGRSAPLQCDSSQDDPFLTAAGVGDVIDASVRCLEALENDPRFFTTSVAVRDLDAVREALGYEQLNLYGVSYGTRVAQHYVRRFPNRVRRVVLDSVVPPDVALGPDVALASQAALDALFERCQADDGCRRAFPGLRQRFEALLARLRAEPVEVVVDHPRTGETVDIVVDHWMLIGVVRLLVYHPQTASLLPVLIDAVEGGDYRSLATQSFLIAEGIEDLSMGLNNAVVCTEDVPFQGQVDLDAQAATYMGTAFIEIMTGICGHWPRGVLDDDLHKPLVSDKPVLLLSGEFDPITPPRYARQAAARLSNAVQVVGRGQGHGMLVVDCVQRLMAEFLDVDEASALDLGCVDRIRPFPIFTSRMGPGP
ncbi:MAG: alpha/beta hydrolase [Gammaproteobacteria bacterium]|nr:alpha/beta hydrolase [Gammaproteobacteria bacterium]